LTGVDRKWLTDGQTGARTDRAASCPLAADKLNEHRSGDALGPIRFLVNVAPIIAHDTSEQYLHLGAAPVRGVRWRYQHLLYEGIHFRRRTDPEAGKAGQQPTRMQSRMAGKPSRSQQLRLGKPRTSSDVALKLKVTI
jgi:hypothetical protein